MRRHKVLLLAIFLCLVVAVDGLFGAWLAAGEGIRPVALVRGLLGLGAAIGMLLILFRQRRVAMSGESGRGAARRLPILGIGIGLISLRKWHELLAGYLVWVETIGVCSVCRGGGVIVWRRDLARP